MLPWGDFLTYTGPCMRPTVLLHTADDPQAASILALLSLPQVIRCRERSELEPCCRGRSIALALIVEDNAGADVCGVLARLTALQPGIAGLLLTPRSDSASLAAALEGGFAGVVQLPVDGARLMRVVGQAMERYRLQQENTRLRTLLPLYRLGEQFFSATSEKEILDDLVSAVERQTAASQITVMLHDPVDGCLHIAASRGMDPALTASIRLQPGDQIAGWVFQRGKPVLLNKEDQHGSMFSPLLRQPDIVSSISFPLQLRSRILGVLNISQRQTDERFSEADIEMLAIICSQAAAALDNARARHQLAETTRMRTLLEQYVAPEVADLLIRERSDLMGLGEIKPVTVLFADIRNFTRLVQQVELPALRSFLNEFFRFFTDEVFQQRGTVNKFMGDAVLAVFGAPVALERPNLAAARSAWAIRARFRDLRDRWAVDHEDFRGVDLGIAVTCGRVFLGNVGSSRRLDYTVVGNEVNIAQRLASESSACQVYLTGAVQAEIADAFAVREVGEVRLRGVEGFTRVFAIDREL